MKKDLILRIIVSAFLIWFECKAVHADEIYKKPEASFEKGPLADLEYVRIYRGEWPGRFILELIDDTYGRRLIEFKKQLDVGDSLYNWKELDVISTDGSQIDAPYYLNSNPFLAWDQRKDSLTVQTLLKAIEISKSPPQVHGFDFDEIYKDASEKGKVRVATLSDQPISFAHSYNNLIPAGAAIFALTLLRFSYFHFSGNQIKANTMFTFSLMGSLASYWAINAISSQGLERLYRRFFRSTSKTFDDIRRPIVETAFAYATHSLVVGGCTILIYELAR